MGNGTFQADASRRKAGLLIESGFTSCVDQKTGRACAGAGTITPHEKPRLRTVKCGNQDGQALHICQTRTCTRQTFHKE